MLNENIHALLQQNKLTMRQLSIKSGVPSSTLQSMLSASDNCRVSTLVKLADFFGVTTDFLLFGVNESSKHEIAVLYAYRKHPELQIAVDKLLGVVDDLPDTAGDDLAGTLETVSSLNTIKGR